MPWGEGGFQFLGLAGFGRAVRLEENLVNVQLEAARTGRFATLSDAADEVIDDAFIGKVLIRRHAVAVVESLPGDRLAALHRAVWRLHYQVSPGEPHRAAAPINRGVVTREGGPPQRAHDGLLAVLPLDEERHVVIDVGPHLLPLANDAL